MSSIGELLSRLSPTQRALLELRMRKRRRKPIAEPIARTSRDVEFFPASFSQRRLWFVDQLNHGSPFYNIMIPLRLVGRLDCGDLSDALARMTLRHETLRTALPERDGEPVQKVGSPWRPRLSRIDLRGLAATDLATELHRCLQAEALLPFEIARGRLLRCRLFLTGDDEHTLSITVHHIIADGWSMNVLVRELAAFYNAAREGVEPQLPALPIQYVDFAVWQGRNTLEAERAYWRDHLAGAPEVMELPIDRPRPKTQSFRGDQLDFEFPHELSRQLKGLAAGRGITSFTVYLALLKTLLAHYAKDPTVVVSAPISYRNWIEIENLIGFFANTLVYATRIDDDLDFLEVLERVHQTVVDAQAHQYLPFDRLVEELKPMRSLSHSPFAQVGMSFIDLIPEEHIDVQGLRVFTPGFDRGMAQFELNLTLSDWRGRIAGTFEYSTALFDRATIGGLAENLLQLAVRVAEDPRISLSELQEGIRRADERRLRAVKERLQMRGSQTFRRRRRRRIAVRGVES